MASFEWVDKGLETLGFSLDLSLHEVAKALRPDDGVLSVQHLMGSVLSLVDSGMGSVTAVSDKKSRWVASIGRHAGNAVVTQKTTVTGISGVDRADYLKLMIDDAMLDVAKIWDDTFVEGSFEYIITRDGRAFKVESGSISGMPAADVAKIMRWVFHPPGLAKREIVSVYVPLVTSDSIVVNYFPVSGSKIPVKDDIRARLLVPCLDRAIFAADGTSVLEHYASATLGGWMPNFVLNSFIGRKKYLEGAVEEAEHFTALLSKQGNLGESFTKIERRDGTSFL